ncbi:MAG: ribosomal protein S18-alanine N-acetyltransferase [Clostridia bacterium]
MNINNLVIYKMSILDIEHVIKLQEDNNQNILSLNVITEDLHNSNSIYYTASIDEKIVGYIAATLLVDHIDILAILVDSNYQRCDIASTLLEKLIYHSKNMNIDKIFLEVRQSNIPAQKLYEKYNFKQISVRKNYYQNNNEDALIYAL